MSGLSVQVRGVGLLGPGLTDWDRGQAALGNPSTWVEAPVEVPSPHQLPPNERRRAGGIVKLSLAVAAQAVAMAGADARTLATVFASSSGDGVNCDALCQALASTERAISPTRFTNSVHNAPAGYWHIACGSRAPSTSLCGFDASFTAGLLEAASQCVATRCAVLLVAADVPYAQPLAAKRPLVAPFAVALLLDVPKQAVGAPLLELQLADEGVRADQCGHAGLERLRVGVPAARALPLLLALLARSASSFVLDGLPGAMLQVACLPGAPP